MSDEYKTMTLDTNEWFTLKEESDKSNFKNVNIFVKNNGDNLVKVVSDVSSILITIKKRDK